MMQATPSRAPTIEQLEQELSRLASLVGIKLEIPRHIVPVGDLELDKARDWRWARGIYAFEIDGIVQYIGRTLSNGMWSRMSEYLVKGGPAWREVMDDSRTKVRLYIFDLPDVFWAASFEIRLIELIAPVHNVRAS